MAPPAGYTDFYELELTINYNNSGNPYLQSLLSPGALTQPPQQRQAGWTEKYSLLPTVQSPLGAAPMANAYKLTQARASLLGMNFFIKNAIVHQASKFKSSFPMPGSAKFPLWDSVSTSASPSSFANQLCSSPEETLMFRLEAGSLFRWEHSVRGIKDYVSDDTMSYFAATSYADAATQATTSVFDSIQQTIPIPGLGGAVPATFTFTTNAQGAITSLTRVTGGTYPLVPNGDYWFYIAGDSGQTIQGIGYGNLAGGTFTSLNYYSLAQGAGYVGTTGTVPISNDPNGLPNYLTPATYWANFMSCLISYTQSGTQKRIAQSTYSAPQPTFPSGLVPAFLDTPVKCNRTMVQRVGNRQTGQIRLTKPARVRRGI